MTTLRQQLDEHLAHQGALNFSPYTIRQGRYCVSAFLRWLETVHNIDTPERLRSRHLHAWQKHLAEKKTCKGHPLRPRSINKHVETMTGFLRYMGEAGLVGKPLAEVLQYVKEPFLLPGSVLSHEQMLRLLGGVATDSPDGYRLRTMLEVLYSSGVRIAELLGLNLCDVDFKNGTAKVLGKGRKERVVPLGRTALQCLESYIRAVRGAIVTDAEQQAIFVDARGRRFPYYTFLRQVHSVAKQASISVVVTPHTFRRSCTTELLRGGANMYHVKELLGHESLDTLKHYAKLTITDVKATHEKCHPREKDHCREDS